MIDMLAQSFIRYAVFASVLAGGVSAYLGVYVLLRRIVFVGIALAQIATLGVAVGHLLGLHQAEAAFGMSLVGVTFFALQRQGGRIPRESAIGVAYAAASAFTILCVSKNPLGEMDVLSLIFGNVLGVTETQLYILAVLAAVLVVLHSLFYKELLFTAFDPDMAETMGYRVQWWEFFFYLILGIAFSLSVSVAGVLVIFSYLVIPATAALVLDVGMSASFVVAVSVAVIAGAGGVFASYQYDLPTGPTIVAALMVLLLVCGLVKQVKRLRFVEAL
ncbi:MAG TPA: metal ABC transporter permease [Candidatus Acidoferrales bacterium]|nr:metal ABC transporter permease [Candidatus Acidoferrales bacterium]